MRKDSSSSKKSKQGEERKPTPKRTTGSTADGDRGRGSAGTGSGRGGGGGVSLLPDAEPSVDELGYGDDDGHNLVHTASVRVAPGPISDPIRRAIVIEKCQGVPSKLVAIKYMVSEGAVAKIYKEFMAVARTAVAAPLYQQSAEEFRTSIRAKAITAIESGLEHDADPYRQAAVGLKVMTGIGEFKADAVSAHVTVTNMMAAVPESWRERYVTLPSSSVKVLDDGQKKGEDGNGR